MAIEVSKLRHGRVRGRYFRVAEYLGHADLSTISRYAHVAEREVYGATAALRRLASAEVAEVHERQAA